jgi:eukaryotic-like serine/threonine-protein kinase
VYRANSVKCLSVKCLTDTEVHRLVEGNASLADLAAADTHLDACLACRDWVAAASLSLSTSGATPGPAVPNVARNVRVYAERYEVLGCLGVGAMGAVYTCRDRVLDRRIALKVLHAAPEASAKRLRAEALAMARIRHPHVVTIYDVAHEGDALFCVMEQVDGPTLRGWMREPHSHSERLRVLVEVARGLAAAHAAKVIHRDVKPDNIFVAHTGAKVGDFGLARAEFVAVHPGVPPACDVLQSLQTARGSLAGTPAYMAPELLAFGPATAASDQFAFAVTAWEVVFGSRPFCGATIQQLQAAQLAGTPSAESLEWPAAERIATARVLQRDDCARRNARRNARMQR